MKYTIKKGSHYCSGLSTGSVHYGMTGMSYIVTFSKECLVLPGLNSCDRDINKLFGWSYGLHHNNSVRIGWRSELGGIHLFAYMYMNGVRKVKHIGFVNAASPFYASIEYMSDQQAMKFYVGEAITIIPWSGCEPCMGYELRPYYGGDCSAPATMTIEMW